MEHFYQTLDGNFQSEMLYTILVNSAKDRAHFVEVGTARGQSTAYLAVEIARSKKPIRFDTVVSDDVLLEELSGKLDSVKEIVNPVRKDLLEAAELYTDRTLDFVYLHADSADAMTEAISRWKPKVKLGGMIAGNNWSNEEVQQACKRALPGVLAIPVGSWMIQVV